MASFSFYLVLMIIMVFMPSPLLSSYSQSQPLPELPTLPTLSSDPSPSSLLPSQALSPDIVPLLPSSGGALPTPTGSDIPTIPSNPSPPNPDDIIAPGPFSAFAPYGSIQAASNAHRSVVFDRAITVFACLAAAYLSLQ
ncbi:classical arabinogalactan protein 25-like [Vicia villosa]|uniref:classical arabinogalactan protein 25-like n=1 Tax=Vicia villosa TaxID=3911 RepID=UPI00273C8707|nr:classical arabinogalactan protein 25-like [Vicia villosa]